LHCEGHEKGKTTPPPNLWNDRGQHGTEKRDGRNHEKEEWGLKGRHKYTFGEGW